MVPGRTLYKRSHSQYVCPYASGLHWTATSAPNPLSGHSPISTTHQISPSNRLSSPVPGLESTGPLRRVTKEMQEDPLGTRARGRKRGKDGEEIWPIHLEEVFLQGKIEAPFVHNMSSSITRLLTISFQGWLSMKTSILHVMSSE